MLVRELERLTGLLKARDATCVCRASQLGGSSLISASSTAHEQQRHDNTSPLNFGSNNDPSTSNLIPGGFVTQLRPNSHNSNM